ncbi:hypothetical protein ACF9IK_35265 [Kitasatospora hibisci]|uniref:hypothetical protein n=1 Tax=Kitasatospora hibisci TaxID=3369522 RepID=UPI003754FEA1
MAPQRDVGIPGAVTDGTAGPGLGGTWISALSSEEFAAIKGVGFDPVGHVFGAAVFNIGYTGVWGCPGA